MPAPRAVVASRLHRLVGERGPARPLGIVRVGLALAALAAAVESFPRLVRLADPLRLRLPGLAPLEEVAGVPGLAEAVVGLWILAAVAFLAGWHARVAGVSLALIIAGVLALDLQLYSNHLYLLGLLVTLATLANPGAAFRVARPDPGEPSVRQWPVTLIKVQVSLVYGFAALSKLHVGFLSGGILGGVIGDGLMPLPEGWIRFETMYPAALAAVATELFVAVGLWFRLTRGLATGLGIAFHLATILFLLPTWEFLVFGLTIVPTYLLFDEDRRPTGSVVEARAGM